MTQAFKTIKEYNMIKQNDLIVCGVSGGADSMAMLGFFLDIKKDYNLNIVVAHLNHMLRGEDGDKDQEFVRNFCEQRNIVFFTKNVDVKAEAKKNGLTVEQQGRNVRYNFFKKTGEEFLKDYKIATAHNLTDMTETMLFHIIRGTGIRGLRGIAPKDGNLIRPLIECNREDIEKYLKDKNINNILDKTNLENNYSRNKIRNLVLPVFKEINKNYANNFFNLSREAEKTEEFLHIEAIKILKKSETKKEKPILSEVLDVYNREILFKNHEAVLSKAILLILEKNNIIINKTRIYEIINLIKSGGKINLAKNTFILAEGKNVYIYKENIKDDKPYLVKARLGENKVKINKTIVLKKENYTSLKNLKDFNDNILKNMVNYDIIEGSELFLRSRQPKDEIKLGKNNITKTIKRLLSENKVPLDKRNDLTILATKRKIVWVEGFGTAKEFLADKNTKNLLHIFLKK